MGTSVHHHSRYLCYRDHPHAYGDKVSSRIASLTISLSSPRVWGQGILTNSGATVQGIIPTRMGTRRRKRQRRGNHQDHPHAYGDKIASTISSMFALGSSPRVWGQVSHYTTTVRAIWIIPTRMGTSA